MKSDEPILGKLITKQVERDAVHVAIAPVMADCNLQPGQHIGLVGSNRAGPVEKPIGIVDPFLKNGPMTGETFYMCLYPRTIKSLRHNWSHPAFSDDGFGCASASEAAIRNWCASEGLDYEEVMDHANSYLRYGDYWIEGGRFEGQKMPVDFWDHYENVTKTKVPEDDRGYFFSCSC